MTQIVVLDTETTGIGLTDQVVELACVYLPRLTRPGYNVEWATTLIKPGVPVSLEARAMHHITDAELADAPTVGDFVVGLVPPGDWWDWNYVMAAHNLEFDVRLMIQSGVPTEKLPKRRICTWRCSLHLYPEAPSHSNQALRYYLGVDVPPHDGPPHRALPDALVTRAILARMLEDNTMEHLEALTVLPAVLLRVPFGKSRGRLWSEMDLGFLAWVLKQDFSEDVKHTARHWQRGGI